MRQRRFLINTAQTICGLLLVLSLSACQDSDSSKGSSESNTRLHKARSAEEFKTSLVKYYNELNTASSILATPVTSASPADNSTTFSNTNLVEQGVDEADIVKNDGEYLYVAQAAHVRILNMQSNPSRAEPVAEIFLAEPGSKILGLYLLQENDQKSLLVISRFNNAAQPVLGATRYNVTNAASPQQEWNYTIAASYVSSRVLNNRLYFVTSRRLPFALPVSDAGTPNVDLTEILPSTWLNDNQTGDVAATDCLIPSDESPAVLYSQHLMALLSIPLDAPENTQSLCTLESGFSAYVSQQAIYTSRQSFDYASYVESTIIHKFAFSDEGIEYRASGQVEGSTGGRSNAFRMNEYNGDLRVVVNENSLILFDATPVIEGFATAELSSFAEPVQSPARLYILREDDSRPGELHVVSQLPNAARPDPIGKPGETIYAARYSGDYAYVVTFRRTDPFYVLNLSNPEAPFIEGELSMPGYSDYLHPIGENLILGVGQDAQLIDGWLQNLGIKVGLFDVSNKSNPLLIGEKNIGQRGSRSALRIDHHAFTILSDANTGQHRVTIPTDIYQSEPSTGSSVWSYSGLQYFELDDGSQSTVPALTHVGTLKAVQASAEKTRHSSYNPRSVLRGDDVFYIENGSVWASTWLQPEATSHLE